MRFLFVDKIERMTADSISGAKSFPVTAPMQYANGEVAPGVVAEAIGQLVSWLCIKNNNFTARPVFLFADKIRILGAVQAGETVDLTAHIDSQNIEDGTFVFSGEAAVAGKPVHAVESCHGYFMPLSDLEDPETTKRRFEKMTQKDGRLELDGDTGVFDFASLVDEVLEMQTKGPKKAILARKTMRLDERFYPDHFPRMPVTPIVMINEMIGQSAGLLLGADKRYVLRPKAVEGIKIRNFVKPGDSVEIKVTVNKEANADSSNHDHSIVQTTAEITKDHKLILRGSYTYELMLQRR
jgi:3-hydroxymyristoyl/3-hydroxydecanoyl-(acyl carrier protein) dehydratase